MEDIVHVTCPHCGWRGTRNLRQIEHQKALVCGGCSALISIAEAKTAVGILKDLTVPRSVEGVAAHRKNRQA